MWHISNTARISSDESSVWVNIVRKMVSLVFFLRSTLVTLEAEKIFLHFTTELKIHHFLIRFTRLSTLLILAVCSSDLAHLGVFVAQLQNIGARRSEVRLYMTPQFFFVPYLWPDQREKKALFVCLSKIFLRLRGYRILQQLIGLYISNDIVVGTSSENLSTKKPN